MSFRRLVILAAVMVMALGFSATANAETETSADASVSVMSNYVWRGLKLSESWVVQPTLTVGVGDFGFNMWSNYDGEFDDADGDTGKITETDVTLSYSRSIEKVGLEFGYIYYELEGVKDTQELYASVGYDMILSPALTLYYDFDEGTGAYLLLSAGYSYEFEKGVTLDAGVSVSYLFDNNVVGVDRNGDEYSDFHNGEFSLALTFPVNDMVSISPMVAYTFPLSDDAEDAIEGYSFDGDEDTFYGGITASLSF